MKEALYHKAPLDLAKRAQSQAQLVSPDLSTTVDNPLCGDRVTLGLIIENGLVEQVGHKTRGCLICEAAAAIITTEAPGLDATTLTEKALMIACLLKEEAADLGEIWPDCRVFFRRYAPTRAAMAVSHRLSRHSSKHWSLCVDRFRLQHCSKLINSDSEML